MSDRILLFFDLDRTLWDFERNSLETLKGLFVEFDLEGMGVDGFDAFNAVYQRENGACWKAYQAGTMTKPVLRGERFRRTLAAIGIQDPTLAGTLGEEYVARGPHQRHLVEGALGRLERWVASGGDAGGGARRRGERCGVRDVRRRHNGAYRRGRG